MVDEARLRAIASRLRQRLEALRRYGSLPAAEYLANSERVNASKYLLLTAIEDSLAIGSQVIAAHGFRAPTDYADTFRSLHEADWLSEDLGERLEAMARFRNLLVHEYAALDDARVHALLRDDVNDLEAFLHQILNRVLR